MSHSTDNTAANQIYDVEYCTCWRYGMQWMCVAGEDPVLPECPKRSDDE